MAEYVGEGPGFSFVGVEAGFVTGELGEEWEYDFVGVGGNDGHVDSGYLSLLSVKGLNVLSYYLVKFETVLH